MISLQRKRNTLVCDPSTSMDVEHVETKVETNGGHCVLNAQLLQKIPKRAVSAMRWRPFKQKQVKSGIGKTRRFWMQNKLCKENTGKDHFWISTTILRMRTNQCKKTMEQLKRQSSLTISELDIIFYIFVFLLFYKSGSAQVSLAPSISHISGTPFPFSLSFMLKIGCQGTHFRGTFPNITLKIIKPFRFHTSRPSLLHCFIFQNHPT